MLSSLYAYARVLSLDVVLGAVVCCAFLGRLLQVSIPGSVYLALALAVWVIYTTDHLWDAYRLGSAARSFRHRYHLKYFKFLLAVLLLAVTAGVMIFTQLPPPVQIAGVLISLLVVLYFITLAVVGKSGGCFKEIMVSLVYVLGVFSAPITLSPAPLEAWMCLLFIQFFLLALVNLLEFSYYEMELDRCQNFGSAVITWGRSNTRKVVLVALSLTVILALIAMMAWPQHKTIVKVQFVVLTMTTVLASIILLPRFFKDKERFRVLGDGVFFLPSIFLF